MSRFQSLAMLSVVSVASFGCMHQPMYQPYPYGQPMYGPQGGYQQPGTLVIPQTNAPPYVPGGTGTYESDPLKTDDFNRGSGTSGTTDNRFFQSDEAGGVPSPKDTTTDPNRDQFNRELSPP